MDLVGIEPKCHLFQRKGDKSDLNNLETRDQKREVFLLFYCACCHDNKVRKVLLVRR